MAVTHTGAAEQARAARQSGCRQVLQKGGVLYAHNAQNAIQRKEDDDLLEAQLAVKCAQTKLYREKKRAWNPNFKELKGTSESLSIFI